MAVKNTVDLLNEQLGKGGHKQFLITSAAAVTTQDFYAVHFVTESVVSQIAMNNLHTDSQASTVLNTTIPAGTVLFLNITGITLTSGVAVGYIN
tara:strand:- start:1599 stop:1880 length:282 start_codon:yes stop_codon:yes gene_type:complete